MPHNLGQSVRMESSRSKRRRKTVVLHCRKLNSSSRNQSFRHVTPAGKHKQQMKDVLNKNKLLALALEEKRCELSTKQTVLDDWSGYINNMVLAQFRMLEMQSSLKSFMKNFDEVLLLLKVDSKPADVVAQDGLSKKWKGKLRKLVELDEEEEDETHSLSADEEIADAVDKGIENNSNQVSSVNGTSSVDYSPKEPAAEICDQIQENCHDIDMNNEETQVTSMIVLENIDENNVATMHNDCHSDFTEDVAVQSSDTDNGTESQLSVIAPCENNKGAVKGIEKEIPEDEESPCTPKLNILPELVRNTNPSSELEASSSSGNPSLSDNNISKMLTVSSKVTPSLNCQNSKIPRIRSISNKRKRNSLAATSKEKAIIERKYAKKHTEKSNSSQRKTFVIKDKKLPEAEPPVSLSEQSNQENISEENMNMSKKTCPRKTFVVKPSDLPEEMHNSPFDRRKTFVKKSVNVQKPPPLTENRRGTITLSKHASTLSQLNEESAGCRENCNNIECVNPQDGAQLYTKGTANEEDKSISEESPEEFRCNTEISDEANFIKKMSENLQQIIINNSLTHSKLNSSPKENSEGEVNKIINCETNDIQNQPIANIEILDNAFFDLPSDTENVLEDKIKEMNENNNTHAKQLEHFSLEALLESPASECEPIPELNLSPVEQIQIKTPIRGVIPKSKKVFKFNVKAPVPTKTPDKNSQNIFQQNAASELDTLCPNVKNPQDAENQRKVKRRKKPNPVCSDIACSDSSLDKRELIEIPESKRKTKKNTKDDGEIKECISSPNASNSGGNTKLSEISYNTRKSHIRSPVVVLDKNEILEKGKENYLLENDENNLNANYHSPISKLCASPVVAYNMKNKTKRCRQPKTKQIKEVDTPIDDIIFISEIGKRNNIIAKGKNSACVNVKVKKRVTKAKSKVKKTLPCDESDKNTFLVHAEVHPIPHFINMQDTGLRNVDMETLEKMQVSVVLNDVFESKECSILNEYENGQLLHKEETVTKTAVVTNSCVAPLPEDIQNDFNEATSNRRKRRANVTYKEPLINRKMRR